jgi:hypothetical protein
MRYNVQYRGDDGYALNIDTDDREMARIIWDMLSLKQYELLSNRP